MAPVKRVDVLSDKFSTFFEHSPFSSDVWESKDSTISASPSRFVENRSKIERLITSNSDIFVRTFSTTFGVSKLIVRTADVACNSTDELKYDFKTKFKLNEDLISLLYHADVQFQTDKNQTMHKLTTVVMLIFQQIKNKVPKKPVSLKNHSKGSLNCFAYKCAEVSLLFLWSWNVYPGYLVGKALEFLPKFEAIFVFLCYATQDCLKSSKSGLA